MAGDINNLLGLGFDNPGHHASGAASRWVQQHQIHFAFDFAHAGPIAQVGNHKFCISNSIALSILLSFFHQLSEPLNADYSVKLGRKGQGKIARTTEQINRNRLSFGSGLTHQVQYLINHLAINLAVDLNKLARLYLKLNAIGQGDS